MWDSRICWARVRRCAGIGVRPPPLDDSLGPAGDRQDHARPSGCAGREAESSHYRRARGIKTSRRGRSARPARTRDTVLFLDEVHRFNKSQQTRFCRTSRTNADLLGATTEKSLLRVNNALLSRGRVLRVEAAYGYGSEQAARSRARRRGTRPRAFGSYTSTPLRVASLWRRRRRPRRLLELAGNRAD